MEAETTRQMNVSNGAASPRAFRHDDTGH